MHMNASMCQICITSSFFYKAQGFFLPQITVNCVATIHFALCGTPHVGSSVLVGFQSGWLVWAERHSSAGYSFSSEGTTCLVWISLSSTWPLRTRCQHTPVSKSTYVTSFCHAKAVLKISRSRGMFWIFQDKDHFRFFFVEHETFFQKIARRLVDFLASFKRTVFLEQ